MASSNLAERAVDAEAMPGTPGAASAAAAAEPGNDTLATIGRWARMLFATVAGGALGLLVGVIVALFAGLIDFRC